MELSQFGHGFAAGGCFVLATWAGYATNRPELVIPAMLAAAAVTVLAALVRAQRR